MQCAAPSPATYLEALRPVPLRKVCSTGEVLQVNECPASRTLAAISPVRGPPICSGNPDRGALWRSPYPRGDNRPGAFGRGVREIFLPEVNRDGFALLQGKRGEESGLFLRGVETGNKQHEAGANDRYASGLGHIFDAGGQAAPLPPVR